MIMIKGTGGPMTQPSTSTRFRPQVSEIRAAKKLQKALTTPKLIMKETMAVFDASPNSCSPIRGTTVRSRPTMEPTNAVIRTRSENWGKFSHRPKRISGAFRVI